MAEFKIPLKTLRFGRSQPQVWGVNFARNIRRKNEQDYWSPVPRQWNLYRVSLAGELHGLELEVPVNFKVTPYLLGSVQRDFQGNPAGHSNYLGSMGGDIKYGITPSLTLDLTYNTDFAQVEVDEQQINLTRFNLFFPEKRPFFLENAGFLTVGTPQQVELFFSRRIGLSDAGEIVPILGGVRLTGKAGRWNLGFLNMQTEEMGDCSADAVEPESNCVSPANNITVARLSRELGRRSSLGGILVNKESTRSGWGRDDYNRTFAVDGQLGIGDAFTATGYLAKSLTFHQTEGRDAYHGDDLAYRAYAEFRRRSGRTSFEYTEVGKNFNPEVGFLRRKGYRGINTSAFFNIRVPSIRWLREVAPHVSWRPFYSLEGFKESDNLHLDSFVRWENGALFSPAVNITYERVVKPLEVFPGVMVPPGSYRNAEIAWRFNSDLSAPFALDARLTAGGFYNGNIRTYAVALFWRLGAQLGTSLKYTHNDVDLPREGGSDESFGGNFNTNLVAARVTYSFTPRVFLQSLIQYNDAADNWSMNIRFGWLKTAGTGLFLVYRETRDLENIDLGLGRRVVEGVSLNRALFMKFTREFSLF